LHLFSSKSVGIYAFIFEGSTIFLPHDHLGDSKNVHGSEARQRDEGGSDGPATLLMPFKNFFLGINSGITIDHGKVVQRTLSNADNTHT
jgi:hypothetical protein